LLIKKRKRDTIRCLFFFFIAIYYYDRAVSSQHDSSNIYRRMQ